MRHGARDLAGTALACARERSGRRLQVSLRVRAPQRVSDSCAPPFVKPHDGPAHARVLRGKALRTCLVATPFASSRMAAGESRKPGKTRRRLSPESNLAPSTAFRSRDALQRPSGLPVRSARRPAHLGRCPRRRTPHVGPPPAIRQGDRPATVRQETAVAFMDYRRLASPHSSHPLPRVEGETEHRVRTL
jgi:hypothetical protein